MWGARFSLFFLLIAGFASPALGAEPDSSSQEERAAEPVLWLWEPGSTAQTPELIAGLKEALSGEEDRHLFGPRALQGHLQSTPPAVPICVIGLEPCAQDRGLALVNLGLALVIRLDLSRDEADRIKVSYGVMDRRGVVTRQGAVRGTVMREVAFELAREIFDATGHVSFETQPPGATVFIGGELIGQTPTYRRLPVGRYDYRIEREDHRFVEGEVELGSASSLLVRHDLRLLPGTLQLKGAPREAMLYVNDELVGPAAQPVELEPGHYTIEVRADGFESFRQTVRIGAGAQSLVAVGMDVTSGFLGAVSRQAVAAHRFGLRLGYETSLHTTTFRNARQESDGRELEFRGFSQDGIVPDDVVLRRLVTPHGLRAAAHVTGEYFGLELLSVSWLNTSGRHPAQVEVRQTSERIDVDVVGLSRLQLRPFQLTFRHFYENLAPHVDAGTGISFQRLRVEQVGAQAEPITLRQTEAFWSVGLGAQYFFSPRLSVMARYGLQGYFNAGLGLEHVLGVSFGVGFQNVFGFEAEPPGRL
jgi:hypothetical protein